MVLDTVKSTQKMRRTVCPDLAAKVKKGENEALIDPGQCCTVSSPRVSSDFAKHVQAFGSARNNRSDMVRPLKFRIKSDAKETW